MRTRINARGATIPSNHSVTARHGGMAATCDGCGREFSGYDLVSRGRDLAPWGGTDPRASLNLARATAHADKCKA